MIYACDNCHFVFSRVGHMEQCPDCGKFTVRPANEDETEEFKRHLEEAKQRLLWSKEDRNESAT